MLFKALIVLALAIPQAFAQGALSYSGRLVNANGSPVTGTVNLEFHLAYSSDTTVQLCTLTKSGVSLSQGVFHAKLDFGPASCLSSKTLVQVLNEKPAPDSLFIRVRDLTNNKTYGYQTVNSMPYAVIAEQAKTIGAMGATTAGQVLRWDGSQWGADTIDEVAPGSIGSPELADNSVTSAKIQDLTITGTDVAEGSLPQSKITGLAASFSAKENALGTSTSSEYLAGDRAWRNFQNDVRATFVGMGYAPIVAGGSILSTDSLVTAIAKLDGRITTNETNAAADFVAVSGDTMTGPLVLSADPSVALGAATKQYVDAQITAVSAGSSQWDNVAGGINYAGGNVGIGVAAPTAKFHALTGDRGAIFSGPFNTGVVINAGATSNPDLLLQQNGADRWILGHDHSSNALVFKPGIAAPIVSLHRSAPSNSLVVTATGNMELAGQVKIAGGAPGVGKVLTSDAAGLATWETPAAAGITSLTGDVTGTGPGATATTIAPGAVTYAKTNFADNDIPQAKVNGLVTALAGKEPAIASGTSAQYFRGDKTLQTLNTAAVPETTNLYFTEPRVLGTSLAGFAADNSQVDVTSADSALVAFQKLQSSINAILTGSVPFENNINLGGFRATNLAAPTAAGDATTKAYVDSAIAGVAAGASQWDNVTGGINYDTGSVGVGAAPFSYNGTAALVLRNNKGVVFESNTSVMTNFNVAGDVLSINRCAGTDCTGGSPRLNLGLAGAGYLEIPNAPHLRIGAPTSLGSAGITITSAYGDAVIGMNDNSITRNLTIKAAGISSGTDNNGGTLTLTSGASSGTGASKIDFQTATPGATGATLNATTTKMTLAGSGFLGLNNSTPTSILHITERDDTWDSSIRMDRSWDSTTDYVQLMYDYEGFKVRTMDNGDDKADIIFKPKNVEAVRITDTGSVGVGIVAPTTKLHVAGSLTLGNGNETCAGGNFAGAIRYFGTSVEFCNGAAWTALASAGGSTPADNSVTSAKIADGSIVDADVATGAAIAQSKIANLSTDLAGKQTSDADLTALAGVTTTGILVRTGDGTALTRALAGTANRVVVTDPSGVAGNPTINVAPGLLPSPIGGDAGKFLKASGADAAGWQSLASGDITTALGFTPINKAGDSMPSGVFDFTTSSVVRVLNPIGVTDVANKQYVDAQVSGASNQWAQGGGNVYRTSGNVGIGTSAPTHVVDIVDNGNDAGFKFTEFSSTYPADFRVFRARGTQAGPSALLANDVIGGFNFYGYGTTTAPTARSAAVEAVATENYTTTARGGALIFRVAENGTTAATEAMRIHHNGRVGIGTTFPLNKLDVNYPGSTPNATNSDINNYVNAAGFRVAADFGSGSNGLYFGVSQVANNRTGWIQAGHRDPAFAANTGDSEIALQPLGGNVGIGTSTPGEKLTVAGVVESTIGGFKFPDGTTQTTAATNGVIDNLVQTSLTSNSFSNACPSYVDLPGTSKSVTIANAGNVIVNWHFSFFGGGASTGGRARVCVGAVCGGDSNFFTNEASSHKATSGTWMPTVPSGTQTVKLQVCLRAVGPIQIDTNDYASWSIHSGSGSAGGSADNLGSHTATQALRLNGNWISNDGDPEGLVVDNSGNVGVGVGTPTTRLDVAGTVKATNFQGTLNGFKMAAGTFSFSSGSCGETAGAPCNISIASGAFSSVPVCTITMSNPDGTNYTERMVIRTITTSTLSIWRGNFKDTGTTMIGNWTCMGN